MTIAAIVSSKNRACQLNLFLDSLYRNAYRLLDSLTIIYTATNDDFAKGYEKLIATNNIWPNSIKIKWQKEDDFQKNVIDTIADVSQDSKSFFAIFPDDSLFYRNVQQQKINIEHTLQPGSDIGCFSLRCGLNTTEQMFWVDGYKINLTFTRIGDLIKWRHVDYPNNHAYGYPMGLDGHIFRTSQLLRFIQQIGEFKSPNQLEGKLCRFGGEIQPCMASFVQSAFFSTPINRVNVHCENINGVKYGINVEELNQKYLDGYVIDYDAIDFSNINCTHKELKFSFIREQI